jgi:hypothetical protein
MTSKPIALTPKEAEAIEVVKQAFRQMPRSLMFEIKAGDPTSAVFLKLTKDDVFQVATFRSIKLNAA